MKHADARVRRVVDTFESLSPATLTSALSATYSDDAYFRDPFHEVRGRDAIQAIFAHMFETMRAPRFVVREAVLQGDQCFLVWDMHFGLARWHAERVETIHGASHLRFGDDGRVAWHRDYWDAAEELYEKLPLVGTLMRWLRRRAAAT